MYMNMNMSILMTMNIYIEPSLEIKLRTESSMSGLINRLLREHYGSEPSVKPNPQSKDVRPSDDAPVRVENLGTGQVTEWVMEPEQAEQLEPEFQEWVQDEYGWDANKQCAVHRDTGETERAKLVRGKIVLL